MRFPALSAPVLALLCLSQPTAAQAQLVTFKASFTVTKVQHSGSVAATGFEEQFPIGTNVDVIYTFESTTPDLFPSDSTMGDYPAITAITVQVGDYIAQGSVGTIGVVNDRPNTKPNADSLCLDPVNRPEPYLWDNYWVHAPTLTGTGTAAGFNLIESYFEVSLDCAAGQNPADMLASDALPVTPFALGVLMPHFDLDLNFVLDSDWVTLTGQIQSLTLVAAANTTAGSNVPVTPAVTLPDGTTSSISLTFDNVETAGETTVTASEQGPAAHQGFKLMSPPVYYNITTTATFTGSVRVCLGWEEGQISNENNVTMFHYDGGLQDWVDITDPTSRDTVNNTVCGTTTSFSPFTLMEVKHPFTGFFQPVDNLPTVNAVKAGAAVPVKFSLGGDLGLNIFASGYPKSQLMQCVTGETIAAVEETVNAGSSSLSYDALTGIYTYVWKTDKGWANSCRELQLMLNDGEVYKARFTFRK